MSYDLFFSSKKEISEGDFHQYFESDPEHYIVKGREAFYENSESGVYFDFSLSEGSSELEKSEIVFRIHLIRPHVFALEAADELQKMAEKFDLKVFDPQKENAEREVFDVQSFLMTWMESNAHVIRMVQRSHNPPFLHRRRELLEKDWIWNRNIRKTRSAVHQEVRLPMIGYLHVADEIKSVISWTEGDSIFFPPVDLILFLKETEKSDASVPGHKEWLSKLEEFNKIRPLLSGQEKRVDDIDGFLFQESASVRSERIFNQIQWTQEVGSYIALDQILATEDVFSAAPSAELNEN